MRKSKNFGKIKKIIESCPFEFRYEPKNHKFRINSTQLATYLERFGTSHKKYVPKYIKDAKREVIMEFLKAFNLGDGDIHRGKMRFCSSSKKLIDDIQEMIVKLDCSGVVTIDKRKTMINPINKKRYKAAPIYSVEMKNRNKTSVRKYNVKKVKYDGFVGCVTTSTGFVVVRRNNRVAISGNTGGMGAYSPAPIVTEDLHNEIIGKIARPTIKALKDIGCEYKGVLYIGVMVTENGPKVLEFNARFGDPETQVILPRLKSDLIDALIACADGKLGDANLEWTDEAAVCVVIASGGYPGKYEKGIRIDGLEKLKDKKDVVAFHAGTKMDRNSIVTSGGRVLGVTALGDGLAEAIKKSYSAIDKINFDGMHFRKDIGAKGLKRRCGTGGE